LAVFGRCFLLGAWRAPLRSEGTEDEQECVEVHMVVWVTRRKRDFYYLFIFERERKRERERDKKTANAYWLLSLPTQPNNINMVL